MTVVSSEVVLVFLAIDPLRAEEIAFTLPYVLIGGNFVVAANSNLVCTADIGQPGMHVAVAGAGAGMDHPFMRSVGEGLATRGVATLRYQFPYMERGSKRPDAPAAAHAAVRAAVTYARDILPTAALIAGSKSFGARMTSQAQALHPLDGVKALAFFGFPMHPVGRPFLERAAHLQGIDLPMLFLQGDKDKLAELPLLRSVVSKLGGRARLKIFKDADHSFHVPARSGRTDAEVMEELLNEFAAWTSAAIKPNS